ncbi:DNA/RNA nuclease SfsA [Saccharicrinis sp. FJH62]|uniref:DNA/RNA nuclease SfsA n=1 Tax=Saccharicrinis sp. FJH62 TaxID=3344657 RepID=UPI0035D4EC0F
MKFETRLIKGTLIKRYKRFLADVKLENGEIVTAHCTNSGTMKSCLEDGADVYLSPAKDPNRKTKFTWEMIQINGDWVGINTMNPNKFAFEEISADRIAGLTGYTFVKREVKYKDSRFDIMTEKEGETCFIEVKNVTLNEDGIAKFPDAVTTRGLKHLQTLMDVKENGMRAVMLYIIQRMDVNHFEPARDIDPDYARKLLEAHKKGVEIIPLQVKVTPEEIVSHKILHYILEPEITENV